MNVARSVLVFAWVCMVVGCGDTSAATTPSLTGAEDGGGTGQNADGAASLLPAVKVRGRVTDVDGKPVAGVAVRADKAEAVTDDKGRFELDVDAMRDGDEVRVSVEGDKYSSGTLPVKVARDADANVEVSVVERKSLMLNSGDEGGRVEDADGFALEVPAKALRTGAGAEVKGPVEVRYAVVNKARDVTAAPGRMEAEDKAGLDGYGMAEVRFYQKGERLTLDKSVTFEIPLVDKHGLEEGKTLSSYRLTGEDKRWQPSEGAMVKNGKVIVKSERDGWVGAAKELPIDSCVSGRLTRAPSAAAVNTSIRAARERGLSLVQAETGKDGSFCLPVTPNDDWRVSAYFDDGKDGRGLQVDLNSSDATGMCGGAGCKDVGDVQLPSLTP